MKPITIKHVNLISVALPLVERLGTSFGKEPFKTAVLVELETETGVIGWGEAAPHTQPGYSYETMGTVLHVLNEFLIPCVIGKTINSPTEIPPLLKGVRGHPLSKFAVEAAVWDAVAKTNEMSLADLFAAHLPEGHAPRGYATVGVSIGIQPTVEETLQIITKRLNEGYGRIKLKIKPGWDVELARGVRAVYPDITMMLDANSAYTLADVDLLKQLDDFDLLMIEQPLGYNDIYEHSKLQPQLTTPICLDESIHSANDLRLALELGACKILNLKPARVGGYTESLEIYKLCVQHDLPLWIGGLLETGVGRSANLAFASLPGVNLPSDISATSRYYDPDLTEPSFVLAGSSTITVPTEPGIGVEVRRDRIETAVQYWHDQYPYTYPPVGDVSLAQ
ncbi:MAG: o-succinylbenzoate synthase [Anaerolineaceae bacterium]|nr:o-succinylbenzoate synthase [Anaerolineaceae bacterium]